MELLIIGFLLAGLLGLAIYIVKYTIKSESQLNQLQKKIEHIGKEHDKLKEEVQENRALERAATKIINEVKDRL